MSWREPGKPGARGVGYSAGTAASGMLIAATGATTLIFAEGAGFADLVARLLFLLGFDAVFLVAAWGTYDFAIGE